MSVRVYVPADTSAVAVGADAVALAIAAGTAARGISVELVRNGSRGLFWLEPLVEVATPAGRIAYGPVDVADVPGLLDAGFLRGDAHPLCLGATDEIPFLKRQERLTFARVGVVDPLCLDDYAAHEGLAGLRAALAMAPQEIVAAIVESGLRGRGGAAFPAGILALTLTMFFQALAGYAGTFVAQYHGAGRKRECARATAQNCARDPRHSRDIQWHVP